MRLIHLADLHLGWQPPWSDCYNQAYSNWRNLALSRLADSIQANLNEHPEILLIAGDLFHSHEPEAKLVEQVLKDLRRLRNLGLTIVTLPGGYDSLAYTNSVYRQQESNWPGLLLNFTAWEEPQPLIIKGQRVYFTGLAFDQGDPQSYIWQRNLPPRHNDALHIALLHGNQADDSSKPGLRLMLNDLQQTNYDYIALGSSHRSYHAINERGQLMADPGLYEDLGTSEKGSGYLLVELERQRPAKFKQITAPYSCENHTLMLNSNSSLLELHKYLHDKADPRGSLILQLTGEIDFRLSIQNLLTEYSDRYAFLYLDTSKLSYSSKFLGRLKRIGGIHAAIAQTFSATSETHINYAYLENCLLALDRVKGGGN